MSDFVNYNKRSITLPFGCKNLAEVLARKSSSGHRDRKCEKKWKCEKLSAIDEYVFQAWGSSAEDVFLFISPGKLVEPGQDPGLRFTLHRLPGQGLTASVQVRMGSEQEAALRLFLERHSYALPNTTVPAKFNPDLPIEIVWNITPLPVKASELASLAKAIFRQVCRLADDSTVTVCYQEAPHWQ